MMICDVASKGTVAVAVPVGTTQFVVAPADVFE